MVEGPDDKNFFTKIVQPKLMNFYSSIKFIEYSGWKFKKRRQFIKAIQAMTAAYLYVSDNDQSPCISDRKQKVTEKIENLEKDRIQIVVEEIESWYLAGLDEDKSKLLHIKYLKRTDKVTKERFRELRPKRLTTNIEFMAEILKAFSIDVAKEKNQSFKYFCEKHLSLGET